LHVAALDADISMPSWLEDRLGSTIMPRSVTQADVSGANGRLDGRPWKHESNDILFLFRIFYALHEAR
jgi:hypothetical protein